MSGSTSLSMAITLLASRGTALALHGLPSIQQNRMIYSSIFKTTTPRATAHHLSFVGNMIPPCARAFPRHELSYALRKHSSWGKIESIARDRSQTGPGCRTWIHTASHNDELGVKMNAVGYSPPDLDGVFAVYKPQGFTSADAVAKIKGILSKGLRDDMRASETRDAVNGADAVSKGHLNPSGAGTLPGDSDGGPRRNPSDGGGESRIRPRNTGGEGGKRRPKVKVGHGGTLDPMATGVLVIGVGKGCRELSSFLQGGKAYRAEGLLGHETDTQDAEGQVTLRGDWAHVTSEAINGAIVQFTGSIMQVRETRAGDQQVPPMFSALRKDGKRMHEMARQGITVEREARPVMVYSLRQTQPGLPLPRVGLDVECGGGFYVRTLIEDLGRAVGSRAHMVALERTRQGSFELRHALPLEDWNFERLCRHMRESRRVLRPDEDDLPAGRSEGTGDGGAGAEPSPKEHAALGPNSVAANLYSC